ncbi:hypothetical protein ACFQFG_15795 [Methylobacterium persicinum]
MPAAIGTALLAETALAGTTIFGVTTATVVGYAVISGAFLALQQVVEALTPAQKRNDAQVTVRQAIPPRRGGHGREKLGGAIFFLDVQGGVLTRGVVHFAGRLCHIREVWLGDVRTGLVAQNGGVVPDRLYQGKIAIESYLGTDDQGVSAALSRYGYWTPAARLKGLAYSVVVATPLKHGEKIFPEGAPDVRLVADLVACYDPRNPAHDPADRATWAWSDNAAIVLLDYLHDGSGYGIPFGEIDLDSFAALADVCDEDVPLLYPSPEGDTHGPAALAGRPAGLWRTDRAPRPAVLRHRRHLYALGRQAHRAVQGRARARSRLARCLSLCMVPVGGRHCATAAGRELARAGSGPDRRGVSGDPHQHRGQVTGLAARFTANPVAGRIDLVLIGRFRAAGTGEWADMASQDGAAVAGPLDDGGQYEAQVAWLSSTSIGDWGDTIPFTLAADTTPTGAPAGFAVTGGPGQARFAFTAPNAANFASARLYRSTTTSFANAVAVKTFNGAPNQAFDGTDARPAGTWTYWVRAFNASGFGDASSTAGPITVTVA